MEPGQGYGLQGDAFQRWGHVVAKALSTTTRSNAATEIYMDDEGLGTCPRGREIGPTAWTTVVVDVRQVVPLYCPQMPRAPPLLQPQAALNAHLLELEATTAAAKEAAPLAQRGLEAEKERLRAMSDRATAAEALVLELERKGEVAAKAAQNTAETFSEEKVGIDCPSWPFWRRRDVEVFKAYTCIISGPQRKSLPFTLFSTRVGRRRRVVLTGYSVVDSSGLDVTVYL